MITSQIPVDRWHDMIAMPNTAECHNPRTARVRDHGHGIAAFSFWSTVYSFI
jgi:hypothetical protein